MELGGLNKSGSVFVVYLPVPWYVFLFVCLLVFLSKLFAKIPEFLWLKRA